MKKIQRKKKLQPRLKNAEHFNLHEEIIRRSKETIALFEGLILPFKKYTDKFEAEDLEFRKFIRQPRTETIQQLEKERNDRLRYIRRVNSVSLLSEEAQRLAYAKEIDSVLYTYREAGRAPYGENSALIFNLVQDLRLPEHADAFAFLEMDEMVKKLDVANEKFKEEFSYRTDETSLVQLNQARKETDQSFYWLAEAIESLHLSLILLHGDKDDLRELADLIDRINGYVLRTEKTYAIRVPSYRTPSPAPGNGNGDDDSGVEPYYMKTINQTPDGEDAFYVTDTDPDELTRFAVDTPLEGADFYLHTPGLGEKSEIHFDGYVRMDNRIIGIRLKCDRPIDHFKDENTADAVLARKNTVVLHFSALQAPKLKEAEG